MKPKRSLPISNVSVQTRQTTSPFAYSNDNQKNSGADYTGRPTDIATQFNEDYETRGLQPSVGTRSTPDKPNKVTTTYNQRNVRTTPTANDNEEQRAFQSESQDNKISRRKESLETRVTSAKIAKLRNVVKIRKFLKGHISATRVNMTALYVAGPLWFIVQLPLALLSIVMLGFGSIPEEVARAAGVFQTIMNLAIPSQFVIQNVIPSIIEYSTGYSISSADLWQNTNLALYSLFSIGAFFVGLITLFAMAIYYTLSGVKCFFGENSTGKIITFILAMFGYLLPVLNMFPWFILWGIVVWRYPK
jgi:hypothetical protein